MDDSHPSDMGLQLPVALTGHVGYLAVVMGQRSQARFEVAMEAFELRPVHYDYLASLGEHGAASQRELADLLEVDAARVVSLTDALEQRGLVTRTVDPADRRRNLLTLTADGRRLLAKATKAATRVEHDLLAGLTAAEQDSLRGLLQRALSIR
ncbi:MAG: hypothetical protein QG671_3845 [Actinomycetota bacterium]|jgi:DNA-binding MarR family transcriptional regulator|nr:hypothetical protein [Actinomycetota bacterium]MDQ5974912.1 hypothetical protein [Actinomycetota bacterium]